MWMDRQTDIGHINLTGVLVTCNLPKNRAKTAHPLCEYKLNLGPLVKFDFSRLLAQFKPDCSGELIIKKLSSSYRIESQDNLQHRTVHLSI